MPSTHRFNADHHRRPTNQLVMIGALSLTFACGQSTDGVRSYGGVANVGTATASSYAEFDKAGAPSAIGLAFSQEFFNQLPREPSDLHHCFDRNGDGRVEQPGECNGWHEWVIPLPSQLTNRQDVPFKWILLNWNPAGHIPDHIYGAPHFDVHFYIEPVEKVFALEAGPCGPEFVRCDQYAIARRPVAPNYIAMDYQDVEAVAPAMGNHLIDLTSPEFNGEPFTRTWIYGVYDGRVTYYEEMVTLSYLMSRPSECFAIKMPRAVAIDGYYPSQSCLRYRDDTKEYTVSMEGLVFRAASPPETPAIPTGATTGGDGG